MPDLAVGRPRPQQLSRLARQANRPATYLTLFAHVSVTGDVVFLVDVQALAFQAAIHFTLPELAKKHQAEHALLLHAAVLFAVGYAAYEPAHYAYMMSMIHDYLGDKEQRLKSLNASFRFTAPEDHSYLTKAQEYWMELLEQSKPDEAERFLFVVTLIIFAFAARGGARDGCGRVQVYRESEGASWHAEGVAYQ